MDHREVEINTGGSLWVRTTGIEVHIAWSSDGPWWPHFEAVAAGSGMWTGLGFTVTFSRPEPPRKMVR